KQIIEIPAIVDARNPQGIGEIRTDQRRGNGQAEHEDESGTARPSRSNRQDRGEGTLTHPEHTRSRLASGRAACLPCWSVRWHRQIGLITETRVLPVLPPVPRCASLSTQVAEINMPLYLPCICCRFLRGDGQVAVRIVGAEDEDVGTDWRGTHGGHESDR